jgi:hypothetical protein
MSETEPVDESSRDVLLAEYSATNDVYLQYDGFRWQAGSFLIAGVFVYWGFLLQGDGASPVVGASSVLVAGLMSCWLFFAHHYRQLYLLKLHRIHQIERVLGMRQHRLFVEALGTNSTPHRAFGPKGHNIDIFVYLLTAGGGSLMLTLKNGPSWWGLGVVVLLLVVSSLILFNEYRIKKLLRALS